MRSTLLIAVGALVLTGRPVMAQVSEDTDPHLRNDCRHATQIIRTGHPAPHRLWAYDVISRCGDAGPTVIADAWQSPPPDEEGMQPLMGATGRLRTRKVFESVGGAAREDSNSTLIRTYALAMMYSFARPGGSIRVQDLLQPRENRPARVYRASGDGSDANPPDLGDATGEVRALLSGIIETSRNTAVVRAAREVLSRI